jgi:hypothetical protein
VQATEQTALGLRHLRSRAITATPRFVALVLARFERAARARALLVDQAPADIARHFAVQRDAANRACIRARIATKCDLEMQRDRNRQSMVLSPVGIQIAFSLAAASHGAAI